MLLQEKLFLFFGNVFLYFWGVTILYEEKKNHTPTTRPDMTALAVDAERHVHDRCTKKLPETRPRLRQASGRFRGLRGRPQLPHVADVHGGAAMAAMAAPGGGRGVCYGGGRPPRTGQPPPARRDPPDLTGVFILPGRGEWSAPPRAPPRPISPT